MADELGRRPIPARRLRIVQRIAQWMASVGLSPNRISAIGLAFGVASGAALASTQILPSAARPLWLAAAVMVILRGLSNMFDGMVAVEQGKVSPVGVLWNEVPDRISDVALFVGAGYSLGGSPVAGWLAACLALFVAYVRVIGVIAGAPPDFRGPCAKQQRMFSVAGLAAILSIAPDNWRAELFSVEGLGFMAVLLWLLVIGSVWTAARRIKTAIKAIS